MYIFRIMKQAMFCLCIWIFLTGFKSLPYVMLQAPSDVFENTPFQLRVVCFTGDDYGNVNKTFTGTLRFLSTDSGAELPDEYTFTSVDEGVHGFPGVKLNNPGIHQIRAIQMAGEEQVDIVSLPVRCHEKTLDIDKKLQRIYWGEFHGHTEFSSDGDGDPAGFYPWARDVACLDFCMMSDHHHSLNEADMRKTEELAFRNNVPGVFVTFVGYEWGAGGIVGCNRNHQNVVYLGDNGDVAPDFPELEYLWDFLRASNKTCITIPHHPGYPVQPGIGTEWQHYNGYYQPVVEIFSDHGSSEYYGNLYTLRWEQKGHFVMDALNLGYKYGITASSDNHRCRPGTNGRSVTPYAVTGLTAIYSPRLHREDLFNSLKKRSCYATSGMRKILVEFDINQKPMGSELYIADSSITRYLKATIAGTCKLRSVEIIKNGDLFYRSDPVSWLETIQIEDKKRIAGTDYYYIRVTQEDNYQAWSSPIWVSYAQGYYTPVSPVLSGVFLLFITLIIVGSRIHPRKHSVISKLCR